MRPRPIGIGSRSRSKFPISRKTRGIATDRLPSVYSAFRGAVHIRYSSRSDCQIRNDLYTYPQSLLFVHFLHFLSFLAAAGISLRSCCAGPSVAGPYNVGYSLGYVRSYNSILNLAFSSYLLIFTYFPFFPFFPLFPFFLLS